MVAAITANRIFTICTGTSPVSLGEGWFKNPERAVIGQALVLNPKAGTEYDRQSLANEHGLKFDSRSTYAVVNIHEQNPDVLIGDPITFGIQAA